MKKIKKMLRKLNDYCEQTQCFECPMFKNEYNCQLQEAEGDYEECKDRINILFNQVFKKAGRSANQSAK